MVAGGFRGCAWRSLSESYCLSLRGRPLRSIVVGKAAGCAVFALLLAGAGGRVPEAAASVSTESVARSSRCDQPPASALAYGWPVKPFRRQHPVRGNFGDPRTLTSEAAFGADTSRSPGSFTFHNGIDISAPTGTPVYPVVSGVARIGYADEVIVATGDGRVFQYFHIRPTVRPGQRVIAYRTALGHVRPHWLHVHLTEIDGFRVHNPADPGHLEPYSDHTPPQVLDLDFDGVDGRTLDPSRLRGDVLIAANAIDTPPLPVPGVWLGHPVTPALVIWRMTAANGRVVVPWTKVADFRHTEPPNRDFWRVYAAGSYQNFPVFGHHYYFGQPGRYLFRLTRTPLATTRLPNGEYRITVTAADICGNHGTLNQQIRIRNR